MPHLISLFSALFLLAGSQAYATAAPDASLDRIEPQDHVIEEGKADDTMPPAALAPSEDQEGEIPEEYQDDPEAGEGSDTVTPQP